jgi:hypothetical protein
MKSCTFEIRQKEFGTNQIDQYGFFDGTVPEIAELCRELRTSSNTHDYTYHQVRTINAKEHLNMLVKLNLL